MPSKPLSCVFLREISRQKPKRSGFEGRSRVRVLRGGVAHRALVFNVLSAMEMYSDGHSGFEGRSRVRVLRGGVAHRALVFNVLADPEMPGNDRSGYEGLIFGL